LLAWPDSLQNSRYSTVRILTVPWCRTPEECSKGQPLPQSRQDRGGWEEELADLLDEGPREGQPELLCSPLHPPVSEAAVPTFAEPTKDPDMCFDYLLSGICLESLMLTL